MDAAFTPEQEELAAQARSFLEQTPEPTWAQLTELGWTGVSIAEDEGGAGLGLVEEGILHEELGRALYHGPFWSTMTVLPALPAELRAEVAAGEASWTFANGPLVPDLDTAQRVAVAAGDGIYELVGFEREVLSTHDETRPLGGVSGGEPGQRLADASATAAIRTRGLAALALEASGIGRRALELAIAYVGGRIQFGRPIGTYQAVAHPLAISYIELELARSLALWTVWGAEHDADDVAVMAAAAKSQAAEAAVAACERSIQAHGGIGFTWEHVLHRLYKRSLWIESWEGSGAQLRAEVASFLLDEGE